VIPQWLRLLMRRAVLALVVICGVLSILLLYVEVSSLPHLSEAGYGDSYILFDALRLRRTGVLYRDLSQPPYVPAQYSPLVYVLYAVAGAVTKSSNPFFGPRLVVLGSFACCIALAASIARALIPARSAWVWGVLLGCSIRSMWGWVLQVRGDFPGICFELLAIRLLLSRSRWALPMAGACAGLALQFKITFVAALATGASWLVLERRWADLRRFLVPAIVFAFGPYLIVRAREPLMFAHIFALSPGIIELNGWRLLLRDVVSELVVLLGLLALPAAGFLRRPDWSLLILFVSISSTVGAITDLQAGGNINYFFDTLFAMVPLAVAGLLRIASLAHRRVAVGLLAATLIGLHDAVPRALALYENRDRLKSRAGEIQSRNFKFRNLETTLRGHRILSTVPRLALIDPAPALTEPFLLSYLIRLGKIDPEPILRQVRNGDFDVVITLESSEEDWRGIPHIAPILGEAISTAYRPHCRLIGSIVHLPKQLHSGTEVLAGALERIRCEPIR
jgi:hypothetical protein